MSNTYTYTCTECGEAVARSEPDAVVVPRHERVGLCSTCDYWLQRIAHFERQQAGVDTSDAPIVIHRGRFYVVHPSSSAPAMSRGHYGNTFRFPMRDGTVLESNNVWNGSPIPERFRDRLPDTTVTG